MRLLKSKASSAEAVSENSERDADVPSSAEAVPENSERDASVPHETAPVADSAITKLDRAVARIEYSVGNVCGIIVACFVLLSIGITFVSAAKRVFTGSDILWSTDVTEVLLSCIAFIGAVAAFCYDEHVGISWSPFERSPRARREVNAARTVCIAAFGAVVTAQTFDLVREPGLGTFSYTGWPTNLLYVPLAVGSALLTIMALLRLMRIKNGVPWIGVSVVVVVLGLIRLAEPSIQAHGSADGLLFAGGSVVVLIVIGVPISFAIGLAAAVAIFSNSSLTLQAFPLQMTDVVVNVTLIALPGFIVAGLLLSTSEASLRILDLLQRGTRWLPGCEGIAAIAAMYIFSGLSGSKIADVAAVAPALTPQTDSLAATAAAGVGPELRGMSPVVTQVPSGNGDFSGSPETGAILGAAAVMGETVPPSTAMLVLGSVTTISTGALFAAGIVPAGVIGLCLAVTVVLRAKKVPKDVIYRRDVPTWRAVIGAVPALAAIAIIAGGIIAGLTTPTEASAVAVVYSLLLVLGVYRAGFRAVLRAILLASRMAGMLLFLVGCTGALTWVLILDGFPNEMLKLVTIAGNSKISFILISVVILIILGSLLEGLPAILVIAPILVPEAVQLGINDLQFGVVLLLAMGAGTFLPPLGIGYYNTCALTSVDPRIGMRRAFIYMAAVLAGIVVIAVFPWITTVVPNMLGLH